MVRSTWYFIVFVLICINILHIYNQQQQQRQCIQQQKPRIITVIQKEAHNNTITNDVVDDDDDEEEEEEEASETLPQPPPPTFTWDDMVAYYTKKQSLPECEDESTVLKRWHIQRGFYSKSLCNKQHLAVLPILAEAFKFLERDGFYWFIMFGTLLGLKRHNGALTPWDNDTDLGILIPLYVYNHTHYEAERLHGLAEHVKNVERVNTYLSQLMKFRHQKYRMKACTPYSRIPGLRRSQKMCSTAFKIFPHGARTSRGAFIYGERVDIFPFVTYTRHGDVKLWSTYSGWNKIRLKLSWILPLRPCDFYRTRVPCPNDPYAILSHIYKIDWYSHAVATNNYHNIEAKRSGAGR